MSKALKTLKVNLKMMAKEIRELKGKRKLDKRGNLSLWEIESDIHSLKVSFRCHHIAYCELRGRTREQIERPSTNNPPDEYQITFIKQVYQEKINEEQTIRASAN